MGEHYITKNLTLNKWDITHSISFNESEYFKYLNQCGYKDRQIRKLIYGLKNLRSIIPIENLIPHLSCKNQLRILGKDLRRALSSDSAKNALTCARRIRDFALLKGLITDGLNLRTSGYFAQVEEHFKRCLAVERKLSPKYAHRILKEYFEFSKFLTLSGQSNFEAVDHEQIFEFLGKRNLCKSGVASFRIVLNYLYREGHLSADYTPLVISRREKRNQVRRFLPPEDIDALLATIDTETVKGKRCFAFFLLMARLGLRGREILRLKIEDLDWETGRIFIDGKHGRRTTLPFSDEVGKAILDYLRHSERLYDPHLFLSLMPPYRNLVGRHTIRHALADMYKLSGVERLTDDNIITVFRHSLATACLNKGRSILEVRDLMRHENLATTMIYAKYDLPSIRHLASEWPEVSA